jgi:hypothetical protein
VNVTKVCTVCNSLAGEEISCFYETQKFINSVIKSVPSANKLHLIPSQSVCEVLILLSFHIHYRLSNFPNQNCLYVCRFQPPSSMRAPRTFLCRRCNISWRRVQSVKFILKLLFCILRPLHPTLVQIRVCIQKFPDCPPGTRTVNGITLCHYVQLYRYFVSQSSEFFRHNPLCCFWTSIYCCKHMFLYRLSPETFGYNIVFSAALYTLTCAIYHCASKWNAKFHIRTKQRIVL